jgi:hypothetical protein
MIPIVTPLGRVKLLLRFIKRREPMPVQMFRSRLMRRRARSVIGPGFCGFARGASLTIVCALTLLE